MDHTIQWHTANPLWTDAMADTGTQRFRQPAILRFARDSFMEDLLAQLQQDPAGLRAYVARSEGWSHPEAGWLPPEGFHPDQSLKLYQPAHGRFYLVSASLVCRVAGLPDKRIDGAADERASFVVRKLVARGADASSIRPSDPLTYVEHGWIGRRWAAVADPGGVDAVEERLPLFALDVRDTTPRRMLAGFIPVASRETYQESGAASSVPTPQEAGFDVLADPRMVRLQTAVIDALTDLRTAARKTPLPRITDVAAREALTFTLLDLSEFLHRYLPAVAASIPGGWAGGSPAERSVVDLLNQRSYTPTSPAPPQSAPTFLAVLDTVERNRAALMAGTINAVTQITGMNLTQIAEAITRLLPEPNGLQPEPNGLRDRALNALKAIAPPADDAALAPPEVPKFDPQAGALYVIRCVYERPRCAGAGALVLSDPSQAFQLASFFDPDAPARPLRITMPIDTSVAGLRKFPKGVSILISNGLRQQLARVNDIKFKDLDDGEVSGGGGPFDLGMICSLSIPIITICALILLMIIVSLLNIVFMWKPLFKICFPLKLKGG